MKKIISAVIIILLVFSVGCSTPAKSGKVKVAATIFPLYDFVRNIGGEYVEPVLVVSPGESPHTFSPTIKDVKKIEDAKVIFTIGFGLDEWAGKLASSAGVKEVNVNSNLKDLITKHNGNPHVWLNPQYAVEECRVILNTLSTLDPARSAYYEENYKKYTHLILKNAEALKEALHGIKNKNFIAFHPAFTYFAEYFGLNEIAVIEEIPGQKPSPKKLIEIEDLIKAGKAKVIFKEPQLSSDILDAIEEDTGVKIETLDPLGGVEGRDSYIKLLKYNVETVKKALSDG